MVESRKIIESNLGQGTVEYLLLLVITISMILLALANVFRPMQEFMQNYMGTYVKCMLSSGELPSLRSENNLKDANPICSFSFTGGKALVTSNSNGSQSSSQGGQDSSGNQAANSSGGSSSNSKAPDRTAANRNNSKSGNYYAGSDSNKASFGRSRTVRSSDRRGFGDDDGDKKRYINNLNKGDKFFRRQSEAKSISPSSTKVAYGFSDEMTQQQQRKIQSEPKILAKSLGEEFSVRGKKVIIKEPKPKLKEMTTEDTEFTFASYFKYIFIAVILLLIIILGGGQIFEMSKSYD